MTQTYDVAIVGLGAMGSMTAWQLAQRGKRVIGFDRFRPPHEMGSSHGLSRVIRHAYAEGSKYVPIVDRARELWAELSRITGRDLVFRTGALTIGPPEGQLVAGAQQSAVDHRVVIEDFTPAEVIRRFPMFRVPEGSVGLYEPGAGIVIPELGVASALELARAHGAELRMDDPVIGWESSSQVVIETAGGRYRADRMILAAGPWMATGLPRLPAALWVARQLLFWFTPLRNPEAFHPGRCPIFLLEWAPARNVYGFPDQGLGVKVARHHEGEIVDPHAIDRTTHPGEEELLRTILERFAPDAAGPVNQSAVCMYTNAADRDFVIDFHPDDARVVVASPCSGHGFKFAPAIGELLADLVTTGATRYDLTPFRLGRLVSK